MDKIAIISDIHGNITALNAVLDDIEKRGITRIFCLGDLVVKCANPDLVVDKVREKCEVILKGNCDELVCKNKAYTWTRNKVGQDRLDFLEQLPILHEFYMSGHFVRLFHASPYSLEHVYNPMYSNAHTRYADREIKSPKQMFNNTDFLGKLPTDPIPDIVGYGHIHTPNIFRYKNKTIFNVGSVGIPVEMLSKDMNDVKNKLSTLATYMILEGNYLSEELAGISFNLVRIPYPIEREVDDLKKSDMSTKELIIKNLRTATYQNK